MESYPGWISRHACGWRWTEALILKYSADPSGLAHLAQDVVDVRLDRGHGDEQVGGDLVVGVALSHQIKHIQFPSGELIQGGGAG